MIVTHIRNGFTLLEVLVALLVIAMTMTAAFQSVSSSSRTLSRLQESTFARWIAESEMANVQLGLVKPSVGLVSGSTPFGGRQWQWQRSITVAADPELRRVKIAVATADPRQPSATLIAFVLANHRASQK
jgi:general secretion pathway protein I